MAISGNPDLLEGSGYDELHTQLAWAYDGAVAAYNLQKEIIDRYTVAWLIRRGSVNVYYGRTVHTAAAGSWMFPAMVHGWQQFTPGAEILSVRFVARWVDQRTLFDHTTPLTFPASDHPDLEATGAAVARMAQRQYGGAREYMLTRSIGPVAHFDIQQTFHAWLSAYTSAMVKIGLSPRLPTQRDHRALLAMRWVREHPLHKPFRDPAVAEHVGLSTSQLNRLFGRYFDTTPKKLFDERRREYACFSLLHSDAQIKEIAYKLGFSSLPHFTKWFRGQMDVAPQTYRNAHRDGGN